MVVRGSGGPDRERLSQARASGIATRVKTIRPVAARAATALALLFAAGCVPRAVPAPPPAPTPAPAPAPPPPPAAVDWPDRAVTPGTWRYDRDARGSRALFGQVGADALVVLRCDAAARAVYLSRAGASAAPLVVRTTALSRSLAVRPTGGTPAYVAVALTPRDPLLDAMAFSRGRIAVEQAGAAVLTLPSWAEIARVVEDCR